MSDTDDDTGTEPGEGGDGGASGAESAPSSAGDGALDQEEIDSLFDISMDDDQPSNGVDALVRPARISHRRLPLLEACFDRLLVALSRSLRGLTREHVELSLAESTSVRFGEYMETMPLPALISICEAVQWRGQGLITLDSPFIYSIIDVLLGGRRASTSLEIEGRSFTAIESTLMERMVRLILDDLSAAFEPLCEVAFRHERLESNPALASIVHPSATAIVFKIDVDMENKGGRIEILIPNATLEPVQDVMQQAFMGDKFGQDVIWEDHWIQEMRFAEAEIEVSLGSQMIPLQEIMALEVGSTLQLNTRPKDVVTLTCGHIPLLRGRVGQVGGTVAIEIEDWIAPSQREELTMRSS